MSHSSREVSLFFTASEETALATMRYQSPLSYAVDRLYLDRQTALANNNPNHVTNNCGTICTYVVEIILPKMLRDQMVTSQGETKSAALQFDSDSKTYHITRDANTLILEQARVKLELVPLDTTPNQS